MPNFSTDADLLPYHPTLFLNLDLPSQKLLRVTDAVLAGLTLASATGGFSALAAEGGQVIVLEISGGGGERQSHVIAAVTDDNTLTLATAPVLSVASPLIAEVTTLAPQAALVHDELLRAVGIDLDDDSDDALDETAVLSTLLMQHLESLGTIARTPGMDATLAATFRGDFRRDLLSARILIDTDADGRGDEWRTPGVATLTRA